MRLLGISVKIGDKDATSANAYSGNRIELHDLHQDLVKNIALSSCAKYAP